MQVASLFDNTTLSLRFLLSSEVHVLFYSFRQLGLATYKSKGAFFTLSRKQHEPRPCSRKKMNLRANGMRHEFMA